MVLSHVWFSSHLRQKEKIFLCKILIWVYGIHGYKKTIIISLQRGRGDLVVLERVPITAKHIYCGACRAITTSFDFRGVLISMLNNATALKDSRVC